MTCGLNRTGPKKSQDELKKFISKKKIVPRLSQFKAQATATMAVLKVVDPIRDKISTALWRDKALREAIAVLSGVEIELTPEVKAGVILKLVLDKIGELASDEALSGRDKLIADLVGELDGRYGAKELHQITGVVVGARGIRSWPAGVLQCLPHPSRVG